MIIDVKKPTDDLPQLGKWRLTGAEVALAGTGGRWYLSQNTLFLQPVK